MSRLIAAEARSRPGTWRGGRCEADRAEQQAVEPTEIDGRRHTGDVAHVGMDRSVEDIDGGAAHSGLVQIADMVGVRPHAA